jgi:hypothetical protein
MSRPRGSIASSIASSSAVLLANPEQPSDAVLQTTPMPKPRAKTVRRTNVTSRRLARVERSMTDRDTAVVSTLARVRTATTGQLERLHFGDVTRQHMRRALASLVDRRLLARLPRAVGGVRAGSAGFVYALDVAGTRLSQPERRRHHRPWPVGMAFLQHSLAVTETYVRTVEAEWAGMLRLVEFVTEPASWRSSHGPGGGRVVLKPDAALVVHVDRFDDRWFVEIDRGTESLTTIARKCEVYRRYWQAGVEQARTGGVFPRVLWLVPDQQRREALLDVTSRQPGDAWTLFAVELFDDAVACLVRGAAP